MKSNRRIYDERTWLIDSRIPTKRIRRESFPTIRSARQLNGGLGFEHTDLIGWKVWFGIPKPNRAVSDNFYVFKQVLISIFIEI